MTVYVITNKINNKKYIGITSKTIKERFKAHKKNAEKKINRYLYDSMNKYGYDNFEIELLDDTCSKWEELQEKERFYIKQYNTMYPNGYNMTTGGDGGNTIASWDYESRHSLYKHQGESRRGHAVSKDARIAIGMATKERYLKMTKEEKEEINIKISKTLKKKGCKPPIYRGGNGGYKHTKEDNEKISIARKGKKYEDIFDSDTCRRLKENHKNRWLGTGNPNYVEITNETKIKLLTFLMINRQKLVDSCNGANISLWEARKILRSIGIYNYQRWSYDKADKEIKTFALGAINEIGNS